MNAGGRMWGRSSIVTEEQATTQVPAPPDATDDGPVSREALYGMVWSEPMLRVAARFGVSSSYMARVCALLNVPRTVRGYWAKLAVGKRRSNRHSPNRDLETRSSGRATEPCRSEPIPYRNRPIRDPGGSARYGDNFQIGIRW